MKMNAIRIIIADDHAQVRKTWKMLLQTDKQINVIAECSSGEEVILSARELNPDVILMDINMVPINGFEATKAILSTNPDIKIIGVSINNQPAYARHMLEQGAKGYVTKNSSKEEMLMAIRETLNGNNYICKEVMDKMSKRK
jgi:Response regulator containing a CheY-like receiver domain and an HTH DNA-binding domain